MNKTSLKIHLIFVVKYRKKLLVPLGETMKNIFSEISKEKDFTIEIMEVDKDHIHSIIDFSPTVSVAQITRYLKQVSTIRIWKLYFPLLSKHFRKGRTFWSDGYFACTIGNASTETVRKYIESQG